MKIKAIYKRNLKDSGKIAAQVAHAVKNLGVTPPDCDIIVLKVSTTKFEELVAENTNCYVQVDKGLTIVEKGTRTAAAWIDLTSVITLPYEELLDLVSSDSLYEDAFFEYEDKKYRFLYGHYQYMVEEYGVEDISDLSGNFKQMFDNGLYERVN